ncbi:MAG: hypothetical protein OIF56_14925 [Cohaesibacter sp.]|nr:hypothetical protein [Cohaesibacter sp.]
MRYILIAFFYLFTNAATADSYEIAKKIAKVIAAERMCGLSLNEPAIQAWIEQNVKADDMEFPDNLSLALSGAEDDQDELSDTAKVAYCKQITRVAKHYKFME